MLPKGTMPLIVEKHNLALRNRRFEISKKWNKKSNSYRLGKRATGEIAALAKFKTLKSLSLGTKKKIMDNLESNTCRVRNCYICGRDTHHTA